MSEGLLGGPAAIDRGAHPRRRLVSDRPDGDPLVRSARRATP